MRVWESERSEPGNYFVKLILKESLAAIHSTSQILLRKGSASIYEYGNRKGDRKGSEPRLMECLWEREHVALYRTGVRKGNRIGFGNIET